MAFSLLLVDVTGRAQTQQLHQGAIVLHGGQSIQFSSDPFDSMVASAASFDIDSPVEAQAEFDPPVAPVGAKVVYRVVVTALDESLAVPEKFPLPDGLELHLGGRGQAYQPTGGMKIRPQTTLIYHLTVTKTGTFTIPAFEVDAYEKPVKIPAATLKAVPAGSIAVQEPPQLFLELPPGDRYVGQLLKVSLMMPADGKAITLTQPHVKGEFIFSEQLSLGMGQQLIQHDGKTISAFVQQVMITPLREGAEELVGQAHVYMMRPNPAQTNTMQNYLMLVDSDPTTLTVKPLPQSGILPGFTGAVGNFKMEPPVVSAPEATAGEPLNLSITISGDGNLGRLIPPPVPALGDWQGFPPPANLTPSSTIQQIGFVTFKYTFIPLSAKIGSTPKIPFSYFDPVKKLYVDLSVPSVPIKVNPSPLGAAVQAPKPPDTYNNIDADVPVKSEKAPGFIGLMSAPGKLARSQKPLQQRAWFMFFQIVPAAILGGLWYHDRRRRYLRQHPDILLKRRARRQLHRQLKLIRRAAIARDVAGFVTSATAALREACAPHSVANPGALVCADVLQTLPVVEQEGQTGEMVRKLFMASNALRFGGPPGEHSDLLALQPDLELVLAELKTRL